MDGVLRINTFEELKNALERIECYYFTELFCNDNKLKSLPNTIDNLVNLTELSCSNNKLELLPGEIGKVVRRNIARLLDMLLKGALYFLAGIPHLLAALIQGNRRRR